MDGTNIKLSKSLKQIADNLDKDIQEKSGEKLAFTLMVFTEGRAQYISNVDRQTSVEQIKQMLDYWEDGMPDIPAHEIS